MGFLMKLFAPEYYSKFTCIADRCKHNCCIGWEIDIDDDALDKYKISSESYCKKILESIDFEDTPHFKLTERERCPHLDDGGLCRIIKNVGEEYLCEICKEHPRFYNYTSRGKEAGLGMACEEACRIILSSDEYDRFAVFDDLDDVDEDYPDGFDAVEEREYIYSILKDNSLSYPEKIENIYTEYKISPNIISDTEWKEIILSLEYLDDYHKELFIKYSSELNTQLQHEKILERALAYFIYRHTSEALEWEEFCASLGLAMFFERLFASILNSENSCEFENAVELARTVSEELEYSEDNTERIKSIFEI
jgi:lysine-N-methylase